MTFFGYDPEAHDRAHAAAESRRHIIEAMFLRMTDEELQAFSEWFSYLGSADESDIRVILGGVSASLGRLHATRANICVVCGVNHDDKLLEEMTKLTDEVPVEVVEKIVAAVDEAVIEQRHEDADTTMSNADLAEHNLQVFLQNMKDYRLEETDTTDLRCKRCGKLYPSLADRMMKPPGIAGCPGCIEKEKWG